MFHTEMQPNLNTGLWEIHMTDLTSKFMREFMQISKNKTTPI